MKDATKRLVLSYRHRVDQGEHQAVAADSTVYRGVEAATSRRQTAKLLANGVTLYAQHYGCPAREVANLYAATAQWSIQLARLQALHDYITVYHSSHSTTSQNSQNKNHSKSTAFVGLPPVSSLCPPKSIVPLHIQYRIAATHQHKQQQQQQQQQHHSAPQSTRTPSKSAARTNKQHTIIA